MKRAKLVVVFAAALAVLAVAAIPASAWFEGVKGTQGPAFGGNSVLTGPGPSTITCSKWEGTWHIESTGKVLEQSKGPGQQLTKVGPHQAFTISKWGGTGGTCFSAGPAGTAPATIPPCILQVEQGVKLSTAATGSVVQECVPKVEVEPEPGVVIKCETHVPVLGNEGLKKVTVTKIAAEEVEIISNIEGLTTTVTPGCITLGGSGGKTNTFKGVAFAKEERLV